MERRSVLFTKNFTLVALGQIISIFGNQIVRYALPLYLLNETGSSALFGAILAMSFIPMLFLCPVGGIVADRVNKRNVMVMLDFGTSFLMLLFFLLAGRLDIVPLVAVTMMLLYGIQGLYQPAVQASVPLLVDPEMLMRGNSVINMITSLSSMLGPVLGGILFSLVGLGPILCVSVGCFFTSALLELFIHIPHRRERAAGNPVAAGLADLRESVHFLFKERPVLFRVSLVYASTNLLLIALVSVGYPVLITRHLGVAPDAANRLYGYAQGVIAAGAVLGGLLAGVLAKRLSPKAAPALLIGCALAILPGGAALQMLSGPMGIYIALVVGGGLLLALSTLFQIQIVSCIQLLTPEHLIGRVIACVICICMCANPLGQFAYGIVFEHIGGRPYLPFYLAALAMLAIGMLTRRVFRALGELMDRQRTQPAPRQDNGAQAVRGALSAEGGDEDKMRKKSMTSAN